MLGIPAVARKTTVREQGTNVALEINWLGA